MEGYVIVASKKRAKDIPFNVRRLTFRNKYIMTIALTPGLQSPPRRTEISPEKLEKKFAAWFCSKVNAYVQQAPAQSQTIH